jgi:hypothetical protein
MTTIVQLTADQLAQIAADQELIAQLGREGTTGMLLAQIHGAEMRVGVLSPEKAKAVQVALGGNGNETIRFAHERK